MNLESLNSSQTFVKEKFIKSTRNGNYLCLQIKLKERKNLPLDTFKFDPCFKKPSMDFKYMLMNEKGKK